MTCKDCIHENLCVIKAFPSAFENTHWDKEPCDHFKDKSRFTEQLCEKTKTQTGYIVPLEMPQTCIECPFRSHDEEFSVGTGLYKKINRCLIAPEEIEDPYRDLIWQIDNKEKWCPLKAFDEVDRK